MTVDKIIKESDKKELELFRYIKILIRNVADGDFDSGYSNIQQIRDYMEKELRSISKWVDKNLPND